MKVVLLGATGFVGSAVVQALVSRGVQMDRMRAPRLTPAMPPDPEQWVLDQEQLVDQIARKISHAFAVINAAGISNASSMNGNELTAANGLLPGILARAAAETGIPRFIHVSSAVVQGTRATLDQSKEVAPFSAYPRSKVLGEHLVGRFNPHSTIYRPSGVHGSNRNTTASLSRIARGHFSAVAAPGTAPSPQALVGNVGDAIAFLATTPECPPAIVIHPWEGMTTASLLQVLGQKPPLMLPHWLASGISVR